MPRSAQSPHRWWRALEGRDIDSVIPRDPPGLWSSLALTLGATGATGLLRLAINPLTGADMALAAFLAPAALCTLVLGYRWGALAAALGGVGGLLALSRLPGQSPSLAQLWSLAAFALVAAAIIALLELARSALLSARAEKANADAAAQGLQLVSQELSHRIQNIFAVISGMITLSAREHPEAGAYAEGLLARIRALGGAHEFVRPHSPDSRRTHSPTTFANLLYALFEAYRADGAERITVSGADFGLDVAAATPVALLFHELATNSLKHGALSRAAGTVGVHAEDLQADVRITWTERGGPPVREVPVHSGFGSRLITMSVEKQLRGSARQDWRAEGLAVTVVIPKERLTAQVQPPEPSRRAERQS